MCFILVILILMLLRLFGFAYMNFGLFCCLFRDTRRLNLQVQRVRLLNSLKTFPLSPHCPLNPTTRAYLTLYSVEGCRLVKLYLSYGFKKCWVWKVRINKRYACHFSNCDSSLIKTLSVFLVHFQWLPSIDFELFVELEQDLKYLTYVPHKTERLNFEIELFSAFKFYRMDVT